MAFQPGTRLGQYEIRQAIGEGGMGEVYLATDTRLNRSVALKTLPERLNADEDRVARFKREAHVLASLNHPNIAAIYGLEDGPAGRALIMELVEGETLSDRLAGGPLPIDEAIDVGRQIAEAVEYAHEQGVIHRDLKPANIKINRADCRWAPSPRACASLQGAIRRARRSTVRSCVDRTISRQRPDGGANRSAHYCRCELADAASLTLSGGFVAGSKRHGGLRTYRSVTLRRFGCGQSAAPRKSCKGVERSDGAGVRNSEHHQFPGTSLGDRRRPPRRSAAT
jgi:serine/threonine protein kinase